MDTLKCYDPFLQPTQDMLDSSPLQGSDGSTEAVGHTPPAEMSPAASETPSVSSQAGLKQLRLKSTTSGVILCQPTMNEVTSPVTILCQSEPAMKLKFLTT